MDLQPIDATGVLPVSKSLSSLNSVPRSTIAQFESLTIRKSSRSFSALDSQSQSPVVIQLLPHRREQPEHFQAAMAQMISAVSVLGLPPQLHSLNFEVDQPFLVFYAIERWSVEQLITNAPPESQLHVVADLLQQVSLATRSRLYRGRIDADSASFETEPRYRVYLDYMSRFYSDDFESRSFHDLYHSDLQGALQVARLILEPLVNDERLQSLLSARKLALLKSLLRNQTSDVNSIDDQFELWLDYFEPYLIESDWQAGTREGEQQVRENEAAFHEWKSAPEVEEVADRTAEVPVEAIAQNDSTGGGTDIFEGGETELVQRVLPLIGKTIGRYQVIRLLGQGGMGAVYQAIDGNSGANVALKVLSNHGQNAPVAIRRFNKEARILASVRNEHVTQLYEVGHIDGVHFIAMEFIDGINLKDWALGKLPLEERTALELVADIARALVEAHHRRIIHRDIKPENILLAKSANSSSDGVKQEPLDGLVVKLSDFGIARQIEQTESMEVTRAGTFMGTPRYMSPEQCKGGQSLDASTDIYSLGITLYELLTGSVPFNETNAMKLAAMHCFDPVPDLRKRNALVSEPTALLVHRMLAKKPEERFANAQQLLSEIQRILTGQPNAFDAHPILPKFDQSKLWKRTFEWDMKSEPSELWQYVTNTERLNRAAGLPSVEYRIEKDERLGVRRFGSFRLGGMKIEWEEHPFEWIEGSRMGVLREFASGPFKWFMNTVELIPRPEGGTKLVHKVQIEPRNTIGKVVSTIEAGWKGGRALDRIYHRIDSAIQAAKTNQQHREDAFEESSSLSKQKLSRIEARIDTMIAAGADLDASQHLAEYIKQAPPQELAKIRPLEMAHQLNIDGELLTDACLHAAKVGLLEMYWDILCPTCRVSSRTESNLSKIQQHTNCEACDYEFQSNVSDSIELVFRVHPEIREVDLAKYCIGGPWHAPHVVTQIRAAANESIEVPLRLTHGDYFLRTVGSPDPKLFSVRSGGTETRLECSIQANAMDVPSTTIGEGHVTLAITNSQTIPRVVRVERTIGRKYVITAAKITASNLFRDLFPDQVFASDAPVIADQVSLLVTQINNIDQLFYELGDQQAYDLLQRILMDAERTIIASRGAIVKTTSEGMLATFRDCAAGCKAAIEVQKSIQKHVGDQSVVHGVCLHRGKALMTRQNGTIDYFGGAVRFVFGLAAKADGALFITQDAFADPLVRSVLDQEYCSSSTEFLDLAGMKNQIVQKVLVR